MKYKELCNDCDEWTEDSCEECGAPLCESCFEDHANNHDSDDEES